MAVYFLSAASASKITVKDWVRTHAFAETHFTRAWKSCKLITRAIPPPSLLGNTCVQYLIGIIRLINALLQLLNRGIGQTRPLPPPPEPQIMRRQVSWWREFRGGIFKLFKSPGIDSASLGSLSGRYDNLFLDCSKIPSQFNIHSVKQGYIQGWAKLVWNLTFSKRKALVFLKI